MNTVRRWPHYQEEPAAPQLTIEFQRNFGKSEITIDRRGRCVGYRTSFWINVCNGGAAEVSDAILYVEKIEFRPPDRASMPTYIPLDGYGYRRLGRLSLRPGGRASVIVASADEKAASIRIGDLEIPHPHKNTLRVTIAAFADGRKLAGASFGVRLGADRMLKMEPAEALESKYGVPNGI